METWNEIPLQRLTGYDFFVSLSTPLDQLTWELFNLGHTYLLSYYVRSAGPEPRVFFWMRSLSQLDTFGHTPKLATPEVRRVWELGYAQASNQLDLVRDPAQALGSVVDHTGMIQRVVEPIIKMTRCASSLVATSVLTVFGLNMLAADSYAAVVLTAQMYHFQNNIGDNLS